MEVTLVALTETYATIIGDGFEVELPVGGSFGKSTFHAYDAANGVALVDETLRNVGDTWEIPKLVRGVRSSHFNTILATLPS